MDEKLNEMERWIGLVMIMWASEIAKDMASRLIVTDRQVIAEAVGHEPTWQNFQDYWGFQRLKNAGQIILQREADREKLRRLVFGEEGSDTAPK